MFTGSIVALVTPWKDDKIDEASLAKLIEFHIEGGTDAIIPCGTTGESPAFTHEEQHQMIAKTVELVNGRIPVIAGAGSNNTKEAVSLAQAAERLGANGVLSVNPYYNKPTQAGMFEHYKAVHEACGLPLIPYIVPSRTGCTMLPDTCAQVNELGNMGGFKDAVEDLDYTQELVNHGINVLSGADGLTFPMMCLGATGTISVVANFAPRLVKDMCDAANASDLLKARELHRSVWELTQLAFCETNPLPAKTACAALGLCSEEFRLPLVPMSADKKALLLAGLKRHQLVEA